MRLIVARPEPDATRTARALIRLGHEAILSPMLDIVPEPGLVIPDRAFQAVLVTSSNAVRVMSGILDKALPVFAVGDQTALEAKRAGFSRVRSAGGAVDDLVALVAAEVKPDAGPLLYAAGAAQAGDLAAKLKDQGFTIQTVIAYRAEPRARLANVALDALKADVVDGVLFYSARSARAFADALSAVGFAPLPKRAVCYCLSEAAAKPLGAIASGEIAIAERPEQLSLFALIEAKAAEQASKSEL